MQITGSDIMAAVRQALADAERMFGRVTLEEWGLVDGDRVEVCISDLYGKGHVVEVMI